MKITSCILLFGIIFIALVMTNTGGSGQQEQQVTCSYPSHHIRESVSILIGPNDEYGTGYQVTENIAATVAHVAETLSPESVLFSELKEGGFFRNEYALVKNWAPDTYHFLPLTSPLVEGEEGWIIGYPIHIGLNELIRPVATKAVFQGYGVSESTWWEGISTAGMSGGPILVCRNGEYRVASMVYAVLAAPVHSMSPIGMPSVGYSSVHGLVAGVSPRWIRFIHSKAKEMDTKPSVNYNMSPSRPLTSGEYAY